MLFRSGRLESLLTGPSVLHPRNDHHREYSGRADRKLAAALREIDADRVRESDRWGALARACQWLREEPNREHAGALLALVLEHRATLARVLN